ncbi:MAG: hypothetical protein KCHDKBKB_02311 [Elusimicrobia bacterium]|nr:hypothetical protein [Elusimicrobiota bacterium]
MKITIRLITSIVFAIVLVAFTFTFFQVRREKNILINELDRRALLLSESLQESIEPLVAAQKSTELDRLVERFGNRERLVGVAVYDAESHITAMTKSLIDSMTDPPPEVRRVIDQREAMGVYHSSPPGQEKHVFVFPLGSPGSASGALVLIHKATHIRARVNSIWQEGFFRFFIQALLISLITLLIIRWNVLSPIYHAAEWIKALRLGEYDAQGVPLPKDLFGPLEKEVTHLAQSLTTARAAAEEEAKLRQTQESLWTAERLKEHVRTTMGSNPLFVVSNREPYMHIKKGKGIDCIVPAGGLITALEPVLRACGGTWIAHGSGDADPLTVDSQDRLRVPPDEPQYTLKRVWLSKEQEDGYYYGFSNEGFWPLCHIAHTRPLFQPQDWEFYQEVNQKFADVTLEEIKDIKEPWVLIQDYHFALLPRLIKEKRPDAKVALFWHIPWPNPESFGICPWAREILHGMLGADLMGFHIQYHCNNFLETVDRFLESRIDWERFAVNRQGHTTWVKPFPISIDFTPGSHGQHEGASFPNKELLFKELGVKAQFLGVGVDRIDYTKGILERFRGVERFLEKNSQYVGKFTFVELGAPSRTLIKRYHDLMAEIEEEVERINWRFKTKEWKPIVFLKKHHSHKEIEPYYQAADVCLVTSLHDGMNLVAKEFIAARSDEDGVLILSPFAGAERELRDALIVNPYDIEKTAEAIRVALEMSPEERSSRMKRMRLVVRGNNIYRWAAKLMTELDHVPLSAPVEKSISQSLI